ncbi:NAD-dependent epimerase/dehydratase family protein [Candidatus Pseudothioglobus sp. Uisw_016]|uniref:NAD-dependent epimerase/dehydratase family protein n=1 Tax=Candidatus Pseudothioglobus sp. Uisw_016 TaxID=3230995 RepID=UPI003A89AD9C
MKKYLITGGSGFIGKHLLALLNTYQSEIKVIARKKDHKYKTFICNLGSEKIPSTAFDSIDTVIHLAGLAHDVKNPLTSSKLYYDINVTATIDLAEAAAGSGVKSFIFVSSTKAGGNPIFGNCADESDQFEPEGVYGKTKREAEIKLLKIGENSDMNISIIRPALVYGPDMKGNLELMLSGIKKGFFPPLPETGNIRSMIHVDDLVNAILLISENDITNGEIYIATDGEKYSSRDIYNIMRDIAGKRPLKWSVPKSVFLSLALISPRIRYKIDKLLGDQCYSSNKLKALGFTPKRKLKEMNETSF